MAGFSPAAVEEVRLMFADQAASRATFEEDRDRTLAADPADLAQEWQQTSPDADLASLTDEAICVQQSYAAGVEARFYDNEGHGLRRKHIGEVHAWLAERC